MSTDQQIAQLRDIVRNLDATGDDGFEGLIAVVLTEITGITFSLAKSGSQRGKDGQSTFDSGAVVFEGKRYDGPVPKNEVLSKIAEIASDDNGGTDLWILGATAPVRSQDADVITAVGERLGIGTLILDWSATGLSSFAVLLAMVPASTAAFIASRTRESEADIRVKLDAVRHHGQFVTRSQELAIAIAQPSIGPAYALKQNEEFLRNAFCNTKRARAVFGQALAPGDIKVLGVLDRTALRETLAKLAFGAPTGRVTAILGADGNGKTWLFGQSWLFQPRKPLTIILIPDDIKEPVTTASIEVLLISALIAQTSGDGLEKDRRRWHRHFAHWRRTEAIDHPRLVVLMDGLNQREALHWSKIINALSQVLEELGGNLVLSCRTPFYRGVLRDRLLDPVESVEVPEWSNLELEWLLKERNTAIDSLEPSVVKFLRNPRVFAIAAELFQKRKIEGFAELSVSRLLFEHIKAGTSPTAEPLSASEFVRGVREHADKIIDRLQKAERVDLQIFTRPPRLGPANSSFNDQLAVVAAGRFFEEIPDDPTLYILKDDSLPLALGLSLLSTAQRAQRNKLDIGGELSNLLDPISALDNTAEVLISALIAGVLGDDVSPEVITALVIAFVSLQNLNASKFTEFRALSRQASIPFLWALERATLGEGITANLSWLTTSLAESRDDPHCWSAIAKFAHRWLCMYSRAPERMMSGRHPIGSDEHEKEYQKRNEELSTKLATFSDVENTLLSSLIVEERGDYTKLNKLAFQFLAAKPLAGFGTAFRSWCFAASFNGGLDNAHDDFNDLIHFNRVDWQETRNAMLLAAEVLRAPAVSKTGRWALVYILHSTGASSDAKEATEICEILTKDRERHRGWRLIEDWCSTDPSDPASEKPDNIRVTAERYKTLDVGQLSRTIGYTVEDHFFNDARPGLVRFEADAAISTMRRFAADVLTRSTPDFRTAAFLLANHTAALEGNSASLFVSKAREIATAALAQEDKGNELFVASQYSLMIAFPHMSGDEQLAALMAYPKVHNILLPLCDLMQAPDALKYERALEKAYAERDTISQFRLMVLAGCTQTKVTDRAKAIVGELTTSTEELVRLCALKVVRRLDDPMLLRMVVDGGWNANALSTSRRIEIWYGSEILVLAAGRGLISAEECVDRIAHSSYLSLIRKIGKDAIAIIGSRMDAALQKAMGHSVLRPLPDIEQPLEDGSRPPLYSVAERPDPNENLQDAFKRAAETGTAWYERQIRIRKVVEKFEQELTAAGAQLIIQAVAPDLVAEIYKETPDTVRKWYNEFITLDEKVLGRVYNIALPVAQIIAIEDQSAAAALFNKLTLADPVMRVTVGNARISLDAAAVWSAMDGDEIRRLRFDRLDRARNDHELASEVLAAFAFGKMDAVRDYVFDRIARPEPSYIARAVMVAGFCDDTPWAIETIDGHKDDHGLLGQAYKAAKYAMERLQWSKHWAGMMNNVASETELWCYAVLLGKIVDGRFHRDDVKNESEPHLISRYRTPFNNLFRHRIETWKAKREKTLFGKKPPNDMFLA